LNFVAFDIESIPKIFLLCDRTKITLNIEANLTKYALSWITLRWMRC